MTLFIALIIFLGTIFIAFMPVLFDFSLTGWMVMAGFWLLVHIIVCFQAGVLARKVYDAHAPGVTKALDKYVRLNSPDFYRKK